MAAGKDNLPRAPIAALVERWIAERDDPDLIRAGKDGGGIGILARELAAASGTEDGWARTIWRIRSGREQGRPYTVTWCNVATGEERSETRRDPTEVHTVTFGVVDRMIAALELTHVWFNELADLMPPVELEEPEPAEEVDYPEVAVLPHRCEACGRELDPLKEPPGYHDRGRCAICVARAFAGPKLTRGKWTHRLILSLYESYITTGEASEDLLRLNGIPKPSRGRAMGITHYWREYGWPTRPLGQAKRIYNRLHPKPVLVPLMFRTVAERQGLDPEQFVRTLHGLHWHRRQSMNQMAREFAPEWGYSQSQITSQMSRAFKMLGLPAHDRIAMTVEKSTIHGQCRRNTPSAQKKRFLALQRGEQYDAPCEAVSKRTGEQCKGTAMTGSRFCQIHDPSRRERVAAITAHMKSRQQDPSRFEPAEPLQRELRAAFEQLGGYGPITLHYPKPISRGALSNLATGKGLRIIDGVPVVGKKRAEEVRLAITRALAGREPQPPDGDDMLADLQPTKKEAVA